MTNKNLLKYYRQFDKNTVWANTFKITPEFHNKYSVDDLCIPKDEEQYHAGTSGLNSGWGDCYGDCGNSSVNCTDDVCAPGLTCDRTPGLFTPNFCCLSPAQWDLTQGCCKYCGVTKAKLYDDDYCQRKTEAGSSCFCLEGEGSCTDNAGNPDSSLCGDGLYCTGDPYLPKGVTKYACCPWSDLYHSGEAWDGYTCTPTSITQPDTTIYTRTGGNGPNEHGGGPIWFHFAAGGNLPNETEAGGSMNSTEYCLKYIDPSGTQCYEETSHGDLNSFWNTNICANAWDYMRDQGGIWDEQKNLGDNKKTSDEVINDIWAQTGPNPDGATTCPSVWAYEGYWCTSEKGCNCHPNEPAMTGPGPWIWYLKPVGQWNKNWWCDAALEYEGSLVPEACGQTCRKEVLKDLYRNQPVIARFDYVIHENGAGSTVGWMPAGDNVFPLETPWNFLHAGTQPLQHSLSDQTTKFNISLNYTVMHPLVRQPLAQSCRWDGCSADQLCWWADYYILCEDWGIVWQLWHDCPNSPCGNCEMESGYPQVIPWTEDGVTKMCKLIYRDIYCVRCWGTWHSWTCDYKVSSEDPNGGYNKVMPYAREEINDTSTVSALDYGGHITTSRPLGLANSHAQVSVIGWIDYKWGSTTDEMDFRQYRVNGSLRVNSINPSDPQNDLFGGMELLIPDSLMASFYAKDYPPIHDLYILDSTMPRVKVNINQKIQDMLHIQRCTNPRTSGNYIHYVINPMKKYYYAAQGKATAQGGSRVFFSAIGYPYSWDVTLMCDAGNWFRDPFEENVGVFRNFHEDEARYWDYVGFYPQRKDLQTALFSLAGGTSGTGTETFTSKETPEEESNIKAIAGFNFINNPNSEYTFNFSTDSITSEKFGDSLLRIYSDFRYIEIHPFRYESGQVLSCDNDEVKETIGSVSKDIRMRHPVKLAVEDIQETADTVSFTVSAYDTCGVGSSLGRIGAGGVDKGNVKINFDFPYTNESRFYPIGGTIGPILKRSKFITFSAEYSGSLDLADNPMYQSAIDGFQIKTAYKTVFDYIAENIPILIVAFIALMTPAFFTPQRLDILDKWWKELWKGER
jgi:hypothetical protein